ncbi:hypothetical protein DNTS_017871 [Danionella cerebrum]|uniref:C2H2-type domain-containing protein n=1 Tax=Danionella cerebrum TaxID=2873325 RepID=A0A553N213_9TELE|nr:hypothetical protein DNTS_017871 [Danionella translucida]
MKDRDKMRQCAWIADPEYDEGSLHMEVDEIVDEPQHVEVEQEDEDCLSPSEREVPVYLQHNWNLPCPSSPEAIRTSTYSSSPISYATDTLLIDDLGIPYTLTADGLKVPQIEDALDADGLFEQTGLNLNKVEDNPSLFANVANITDSKLQTQLSSLCPNFSLDHASVEATQVSPNLETNPSDSSNTLANAHASDLPSVPIHVMSNTKGSNTPILFLPPSQLRPLSSPISKVNPELITLSLQGHTQSTTMFLVVSTPQASSPEKAHQRSTSSTAAPALATCPLDVGSTSNSSTVSSDSATVSSGLTIPTSPTSSTASSSTSTVTSSPAKQLHNDTCPDLPVPTSFREALLRLSVSVEKNQEPENPLAITTSMPDSSTSAHEHKNHKTEESCDGDQNHLVDTTSSLHPGSPIIPSSTPNNQEPRRILYCQYCPRVFYYVSDLERHSITHSQSKPHVCHICGKAFKRSSHLERHKHIHTGQRNFVCQLCPRRFRESGELMRHQRVHTGEKPYQCLICHMRFAERNTLRRHTKRKHQGQQLEALDMKVLSEGGSDSLVGVQGVSEENEEWYSSTLPQRESDSDTGGEGTS